MHNVLLFTQSFTSHPLQLEPFVGDLIWIGCSFTIWQQWHVNILSLLEQACCTTSKYEHKVCISIFCNVLLIVAKTYTLHFGFNTFLRYYRWLTIKYLCFFVLHKLPWTRLLHYIIEKTLCIMLPFAIIIGIDYISKHCYLFFSYIYVRMYLMSCAYVYDTGCKTNCHPPLANVPYFVHIIPTQYSNFLYF
jgi:hypothetical protein